MICKVKQAMEKFGMPSDCTVTVGLSGGADSVALLDILLKLSDEYSLNVKAAHVNHRLRGEQADADESFVRALCEKRGVVLSVLGVDVAAEAKRRRIGLEECGRQIRYEFFASLDTDYIATAHTLSDCVETMLINLSRGCSLTGLCSIPPVRDKIIRPLILCTGDEVRQYCKLNGLEYVIDSSNNEDEYLRNRVRHSVVPNLKSLQPRFEENAGRCLDSLRDDNGLLDEMTNDLIAKSRSENGYRTEKLLSAHVSLLRRALYKILYDECGVMPERKHIELLCEAMHSEKDCQLGNGVICRCRNGLLSFGKPDSTESWCQNAKIGENVTPCSKVTLMRVNRIFYSSLTSRQKGCQCFDNGKVENGLVLRSRKAGDKITDAHRGNTKTLKKLFCENKIEPEKRNSYAVLCDGEAVICAEGFCTDKKYAVDENTQEIIYIMIERML